MIAVVQISKSSREKYRHWDVSRDFNRDTHYDKMAPLWAVPKQERFYSIRKGKETASVQCSSSCQSLAKWIRLSADEP